MESRYNLPRVIIGAASSGSGKTTITCGILKLLQKKGLKPVSFKCGPDYIDPMFHREVLGIDSRNLDLFFNSQDEIKEIMAKTGEKADSSFALIEGVMGYYDGIGGNTSRAGTFHMAEATETPGILIVNGKGKSRSILAEILGFISLEKDSWIKGVILNQISPMMYQLLKEMIEERLDVKVLGYVPKLENCSLESRHLGLITAKEVENLDETLDEMARAMESTVDIEGIIQLANEAKDLKWGHVDKPFTFSGESKVKVAIGMDKAFSFYYRDNLELLEMAGCKLVPFSPLEDKGLPEDVQGLILGGGYPQLYGGQLSSNMYMLESVYQAIDSGMPCLAECGGFMYLHKWILDREGNRYQGVGIFDQECVPKDKLVRFGYIELTAQVDSVLSQKGDKVRGHEFHYWESGDPGQCFTAKRASGKGEWPCIRQYKNTLAGYPHLNYRSMSRGLDRFVGHCKSFSK